MSICIQNENIAMRVTICIGDVFITLIYTKQKCHFHVKQSFTSYTLSNTWPELRKWKCDNKLQTYSYHSYKLHVVIPPNSHIYTQMYVQVFVDGCCSVIAKHIFAPGFIFKSVQCYHSSNVHICTSTPDMFMGTCHHILLLPPQFNSWFIIKSSQPQTELWWI